MKHGQMVRYYVKGLIAFAMLGVVGACADSSAPAAVSQEAAVYAPANFLKVGNGTVFRVNNAQGILQRVGAHTIYIPAGAICDPLTSGYGSTTWDDEC